MTVSHANVSSDRSIRPLKSNPVNASCSELPAEQLILLSYQDTVLRSVDRNNVQRSRGGDTNSTSLANGEAMNAGMLS